ncbi:hypothetical protein [Rhizobium sp. CECT 9324]|uniref:hypothetical protein n=1 Tax=Rhizobium sp. CECT 9324 TaxID=2845820 RepID=UPI001E2C69E0|nr:hypothetical protein [Rhizobium sp. CECT 9324]CAH0343144.1 hypothetical protein RHI9324_04877 [Rhizobium sp. CECT 9324]
MISESIIEPLSGREGKFVFLFLDERGSTSLNSLAHMWRGHFPDAVFLSLERNRSVAGERCADNSLGEDGAELSRYIDALKPKYGVTDSQIIIVGYGKEAAVALSCGLNRSGRLGAIIAFSAELGGFDELGGEVLGAPPVLLVHGELDKLVSPSEFLQNFHRLESSGVPTFTCFRPKVATSLDAMGANAAMYFIQGVFAAHRDRDAGTGTQVQGYAAKIKLVIWDLDDTLWHGTLDDVGELKLNSFRVDIIKKLNRSGVVSAICSKNDLDKAKATLEEFGIWDEFVFPRIAFVAKGDALKSLISDMQLKPENCVFIDDNVLNLAEANAVLPDLHTFNAMSSSCDSFLLELVEAHCHVQKSRVSEYRSLQRRVGEGQAFDGDRESFLATCDIHVAIAWRADVVDFATRIEELINRTNQLNFLKTRVKQGAMVDFVSEPSLRQCLAVFAWDRFGYHGLVGFIAVDMKTKTLLHMAFSCRVMHMGIENWLLLRALAMFPDLNTTATLTVTPNSPSWLKEVSFNDPEIHDFIMKEEKKSDGVASLPPKLRIMANCHSGVWAHFSGLREITQIDNFPRAFVLPQVLSKDYLRDSFAPALVYEFGTDFYNDKWPEFARARLDVGLYEQCASEFCAHLQAQGKRMLVVGHPKGISDELLFPNLGITRERVNVFGGVWKKMAREYDCVELADIDKIVGQNGMVDYGHFTVEASKNIAAFIAQWFNSLPEAMFLPEQAGTMRVA